MDKIAKVLSKLSEIDRKIIKKILFAIIRNKWEGLDVKRLKGFDTIFRIRKGILRIIVNKSGDSIKIVKIEKRNDKTYRFNS